jgi:K+-sensing histidine kinase KdpD
VRVFALDDRSAAFALRGVLFLAMLLMLVHSRRLEESLSVVPFALAFLHLATSFFQWRSDDPRLNRPAVQSASFLWDVAVLAAVMYAGEGFDDELFLGFFLVMFMSATMSRAWQSFLVAAVASVLYAALWNDGRAGAGLPATNLFLRLALFQIVAFFTAVMAERVRGREERARNLEMRLALQKLANGGWGIKLDEDIDPDVAKSVRAVNTVMDNLARALERVVAQNDELRATANAALTQLAHEKERLEAQAERSKADKA